MNRRLKSPPLSPRAANRQRGAALVLALLIVSLVTTVAVGMIWQQWRAIEIESAERARQQASWLLSGALDWARLILREDARDGGGDALTEPWATPLEEVRLSSFLAQKTANSLAGTVEADVAEQAFLSGQISDAQARYNLNNLLGGDEASAKREDQVLARLCESLGLPAEVAPRISRALRLAQQAEEAGSQEPADMTRLVPQAPLRPQRPAQLSWLGLEAEYVERLSPFVTFLPERTTVNVNTAPVEVLTAVVPGLDRGTAQRLVQQRLQYRKGFESLGAAQGLLPQGLRLPPQQVSTTSQYFEVIGVLRFGAQTLQERSVLRRRNLEVIAIQRERLAGEPLASPR